MMNAKIKQRIENITRGNFNLYPDHWLGNRDMVSDFAKALWENRNEMEKEEDTSNGVTFEDYLRIIRDEFLEWFEDNYLHHHEVEAGNWMVINGCSEITEDFDAQHAAEVYLTARENNPEVTIIAKSNPYWYTPTRVRVEYDVFGNP